MRRAVGAAVAVQVAKRKAGRQRLEVERWQGANGAQVLGADDPSAFLALHDALHHEAREARREITRFFEFVMREETSRAPIRILPHQKVGLEFIMAHDRSVNMWPVGTSKTFSMAGLTLYLLGQDVTARGAIVSATQEQAAKPLGMVRDYIESSAELRLVYPHLMPSRRRGDTWSQTALTVDRPPGIRDASLVAVGVDGAIAGARLNWIVVDDILDRENTATKEQRDKVYEWFDSSVLSRLDPKDARIVVTNTAWHPDDLVHRLEALGWATLRMDILGNIEVKDDHEKVLEARERGVRFRPWDSPEVRPASPSPTDFTLRLTAHDPDPRNETALWPGKFSSEYIAKLRRRHLPHRFNQLYRNICRDDETARCKLEWIERCKEEARKRGVRGLQSRYRGSELVFTGVDLAVAQGEESDLCAFFTFAVLPTGHRLILDIESGQFDGPTIIRKLFDIHNRYDSVLRVENNACFPAGSRVLTRERGYVPIEAVKVGEHTWTHARRWRPVTALLEGESRTMHDARLAGGLPISATPNHWFWMREAARTPGRKGGRTRPTGEPCWVSVGFVDKPAYVEVAAPRWPELPPTLTLPKTQRAPEREVEVGEDDALTLGLFMAEGHATRGQVFWTFNAGEEHLARHVEAFARRLVPKAKVTHRRGRGTLRVVVSSTQLARALAFGARAEKCPPLAWLGWPLALRLALVRGWLLGDGCLRTNNARTAWPQRFLSGFSISRNWMLWARATLLEAGHRPTLSPARHRGRDVIEGRTITRRPGFTLTLNAEDSARLRAEMSTEAEAAHWPAFAWSGRASNSTQVIEPDGGVWAHLRNKPGVVRAHNAPVYNLVVEEDSSFTVEDAIVHNAQDFILQFARAQNVALPIRPHTTGRVKAHPEHGVEGLFIELYNGAWLIPNDTHGECPREVQAWVDDCLNYQPAKHTPDRLMASYFAREQAKEFGVLTGSDTAEMANVGGSIAMDVMSR